MCLDSMAYRYFISRFYNICNFVMFCYELKIRTHLWMITFRNLFFQLLYFILLIIANTFVVQNWRSNKCNMMYESLCFLNKHCQRNKKWHFLVIHCITIFQNVISYFILSKLQKKLLACKYSEMWITVTKISISAE